ncbi:hypothetical protein NP493_632g01025 [Ridgeia piscesae]|uniref:Uncharacterized protein n=1 Tax=Ridgeia piscesae TaxID=27915 RepID=A0AAD9NNI5_RIDPI|nr:hypothetical protein NP493_632g01025 [Ridgeia piscesae]
MRLTNPIDLRGKCAITKFTKIPRGIRLNLVTCRRRDAIFENNDSVFRLVVKHTLCTRLLAVYTALAIRNSLVCNIGHTFANIVYLREYTSHATGCKHGLPNAWLSLEGNRLTSRIVSYHNARTHEMQIVNQYVLFVFLVIYADTWDGREK